MKPVDKLSFQLYSARTLAPIEKQFELLADVGYRRVEPFAGLLDDVPRLRRLLDRHRMTAPTIHIGIDRLRADFKAMTRTCKELGVLTVFAPAPPGRERDGGAAQWRALGQELAKLGEAFSAEDLTFGWHNHHWEYQRSPEGKFYLDIMFAEAPELVWEADVAWIARAGADPVAEIGRHNGRLVGCHVKDIAPPGQCADEDGWADPGHGVLDWAALRAAMTAADVELLVVEHDKPNDVARFARRAFETVSTWS